MNNIAIVCVLVIVASTNGAPVQSDKKRITTLYFPEDNVEQLTIDNFKQKIENSSKAWLVEFYMAWCGDCQRFAPSWKALGNDIYAWRDLVQVAVIACSDERNLPVCREHEVTWYPTVKYFHENYQSIRHGIGIRINETNEDPASHRRHLLDRIVAEIMEGRGKMYPNILPYEETDPLKLFDSVSNDTKYVFLVIEPPETYLGAEVAMDLHKTSNIVIRHAFNNNSELLEKLPVEQFPAVVVFDRENKLEVIIGNPKSRKEVKETIANYLKNKGIEIVEETAPEKEHPLRNFTNPYEKAEKELREDVKKMKDVVFLKDLEAALRYSLKQEVALFRSIKQEKLDALKAFLEVIKKYFPFNYKAARLFPKLINLTNVEELEGYKITELVKKGEEKKLFASRQGFLECRGSQPQYRGYPCSLWKLFHYLTVNARDEENPKEVLDAMHGYITHFFSCKDCSDNFLKMAERRNLKGVSSLDESILWLWAAHNEVRNRLQGDSTEDPEFPKLQFPTQEYCPQCVNSEVNSDTYWNEKEVLRYLKTVYAKHNLRYLGSDSRDFFLGLH